MFSFSHWYVKGFLSIRIVLKINVLQDRKIYPLQARPYIIHPGNFTGWGSEGVKYRKLQRVKTAVDITPEVHGPKCRLAINSRNAMTPQHR